MKSIGFWHFATCFSGDASLKFQPYLTCTSHEAVYISGKSGNEKRADISFENSSHTLVYPQSSTKHFTYCGVCSPLTHIVVAAPIEMPCTTRRIESASVRNSSGARLIQCSTSRRSFHPICIASPSLCPCA